MKAKLKLTFETEEARELFSAAACAVAVLDGTAGGYTPQEKLKAKLTLLTLQSRMSHAL